MPDPTPQQIQTVQANLNNMMALNGYVYDNGLAKISNAYFLLSETDDSDPGNVVGMNIFEGIYWAIGSELGPAGNFFASFLSGLFANWANNPPPGLNKQFADFVTRFEQTRVALDAQLRLYYANVVADWNDSVPYNGQTVTIADLSTAQFPADTDPAFTSVAATALLKLDQELWTQMLVANYAQLSFDPMSFPAFLVAEQMTNPQAWFNYYKNYPANYLALTEPTMTEQQIARPENGWTTLSDAACTYLIKDMTPSMPPNNNGAYNAQMGQVINPDALFTRVEVFTQMGLKPAKP